MTIEQQQTALVVAIAKEIDGLPMGILTNGTPYFNGRALAKLCGVAPSVIIGHASRWLTGDRKGRLAQMLLSAGLNPDSLYVEVEDKTLGSGKVHAYTDDICMVVLEYFAFEASGAGADQALANYRKLGRAGLRLFIYHALGYDPAKRVPEQWRHFHDRQVLHSVPSGYFSVFKECADFELAIIRGGLPMDSSTVPDISVGQAWAQHWKDQKLEESFGPRKVHAHNYPPSFAQSASNPQPMKVYPLAALGTFRLWMESSYIPTKFPRYLATKVASGALPASTAELLLAEVTPPQLPEAT